MVASSVRRSACLAITVMLFAGPSAAQEVVLEASTDRSTIRENESVTYVLRAEGAVRGEPDLSEIERDFDVLNRSNSTRVSIINGKMQQVAEWEIELMPMRAGEFTLPPVTLGSAQSNSVTLEVLPPLQARDDGAADIFMEVEALPESAYVQSQVIFTLRLFVGVGTGRATLTAPQISGGEAIVERLGEDSQYQTMRDGRNFVVRERRYAVFPQQTGVLTIGPAVFEAMVIPNRGFSRVQRFRSETVDVKVEPAVSPPPEYPNAVWLPASRLTLSERWSDESFTFDLGIPRTRTITVEADGLLQTQLPELEIDQADGIRQYADQPELDRTTTAAGLTAHRIERFAVIAQREGEVELPGVELPWWNVNERRWEVARLDSRTVTVLPSAETVVEPDQAQAAPAPVESEPAPQSLFWPVLSAVLALGWAVTAALWWRSTHASALRQERGSSDKSRSAWGMDRRLMKSLRQACSRNDATEAQRLVMQWAHLRFPDDPPNTLGAFAQRLPGDAAAAIDDLEECLYGRMPRPWDGAALKKALDGIQSVASTARGKDKDALLPLYR